MLSSEVHGSSTLDELAENWESLVQRWVLLELLANDVVNTFLDHHIDEILLIALQDNSKENQASCLSACHGTCHEHVGLISDHEVSSGIHEHLSEDLWRIKLVHQGRIEERDSLKSQWETSPVSQELNVDLGVVDVELSKVCDVLAEKLVTEVASSELILESVLV